MAANFIGVDNSNFCFFIFIFNKLAVFCFFLLEVFFFAQRSTIKSKLTGALHISNIVK